MRVVVHIQYVYFLKICEYFISTQHISFAYKICFCLQPRQLKAALTLNTLSSLYCDLNTAGTVGDISANKIKFAWYTDICSPLGTKFYE